jgi:hypothetical protein
MARSDEDIASAVRKGVAILGEENFTGLEVEAVDGLVTISGAADRKTTHDLAVHIASQVPGVLEVADDLGWQWDDTHVKPTANPTNANGIRREPWIVGPRVEEAVS